MPSGDLLRVIGAMAKRFGIVSLFTVMGLKKASMIIFLELF
jgi:hypothetical protein